MARATSTSMLPPPAPTLTPAIAREWLHRRYLGLASLGTLGAYPGVFRTRGLGLRRDDRDRALRAARTLARDVERITAACGRVLATKQPVPMCFDPAQVPMVTIRQRVAELRALIQFESVVQHRGSREPLKRALRALERAAKQQRRKAAA